MSWRAALATASDTLELDVVLRALDEWRAHAVITGELGHRFYREWLTGLEHRARTGERPEGSGPWAQLKAELGL